jgi:hypothetical protein
MLELQKCANMPDLENFFSKRKILEHFWILKAIYLKLKLLLDT